MLANKLIKASCGRYTGVLQRYSCSSGGLKAAAAFREKAPQLGAALTHAQLAFDPGNST